MNPKQVASSTINTTSLTDFVWQDYYSDADYLSTAMLPSYNEKTYLWFENIPQWYPIFMTFTLIAVAIATVINSLTIVAILRYT